ncbi:hypothetical protein KK137_09260 [Croceibacterium sp. LX-88]|uniref:LysR substrate-binding domain-containing protein n=1 Tax=Croceibacterium selenioxidans TaxID=2838833 RepID=A0ABS5W5L7_9SPHN|nr:hypothetical protein [Croceibacterium selenioxidans]
MPVAGPDIAARVKARAVTADLLSSLPCIAYDESLPLIREFFQEVFGTTTEMQAVAVAPDLRLLLEMTKAGAGWTVLPDYLCADAVKAGRLVVLPTPGEIPENMIYLAWNKPSLRHPRVVYVRDYLLASAKRNL